MTQKNVVGVVGDLQKKFQPLFEIFCLSKKKLAIMRKMVKKQDFGLVEGNIMPWTPLNHLCFLAYLFLGSPITFGSLLQAKYKVLGFLRA